ncbi:MAG: ferritin-like domain-containing protein, partial [Terriglobales bacterium]
MKNTPKASSNAVDRRSFIRTGLTTAGTAAMGAALLSSSPLAFADQGPEEHGGRLTKGDAALLRFAAAAEILETDFWVQYNELGGIPDNEVPGGSGNSAYTAALSMLDGDMAQYVHDNT